jgi:hypothetical protein
MANNVIQKVTISKKDIESISTSGNYLVRYRIVGDGGSKTSHWSPIFALSAGNTWGTGSYASTGAVLVSYNSNINYIDVSWNFLNTLQINNYDVYIAYGATSTVNYFSYYDSTSQPSITLPKPSAGINYLKVAIFAKGSNILGYDILKNVTYQTTFTTNPPASFLGESAVFTL